jgi:biotin synthase
MGAAWRDVAGRKRGFERILQMVREVRGMGMEVCTTLGMLTPEQAKKLKEAWVVICFRSSLELDSVIPSGLTAYNHNLDTSREFYPEVCCRTTP